ncbi:MAG: tetratricopeptide repeat protein [Deltaproteobacteria bacterium]|nr:tetratricopeptide repeat protein [Deltaproteobacteria bacterium]
MAEKRTSGGVPHGIIQAAMLAFLLTAGFLVYSNTFHVPFYFDDNGYITSDTAIRITSLTPESLISAAVNGKPRHRLIPNLTFALNYYFGRYHVFGYHVVNLLIHLACGLILFFLFKYTLILTYGGTGRDPSAFGNNTIDAIWPAFFAALVWLVHPLNSQAVTYVVQRMTSLVALFYFLSMLLYVTGRMKARSGRPWGMGVILCYAGAAASGLLAVISKENAATLPLFIFLYEWFFFQDLDTEWIKKRLLWIGAAAVLFGGIAFFYLGENPFHRILSSYAHRDFTLAQRVMTEWRVVVWYISLIFFPAPSRLTLDYDYPLSFSLFSPPTTIFCLVAWIAILVAALHSARRNRLISFCLFWYMGNLLIESSVVGIEIIYEHRNYLPSAMVFLLFTYLVYGWIKTRRAAAVFLCIIAALCGVWTFQRNRVWTDRVALWQDNSIKSPAKFRPHNDLGVALYDSGKYKAAIRQYQLALQLKPNNLDALNNMGNALAAIGNIEQSVAFYKKATDLAPGYIKAMTNLGSTLYKLGRFAEAAGVLEKAVLADSMSLEARVNLGAVFMRMNRIKDAEKHLLAAVRIAPHNAEAFNNLGTVYVYEKRFSDAKAAFQKALELSPGYASAKNNIERLKRLTWR